MLSVCFYARPECMYGLGLGPNGTEVAAMAMCNLNAAIGGPCSASGRLRGLASRPLAFNCTAGRPLAGSSHNMLLHYGAHLMKL